MRSDAFMWFIKYSDSATELEIEYKTSEGKDVTEKYSHAKVKPCPFCGSSAIVQPVTTYRTPAVRVRCSACCASSNLQVASIQLYPEPHNMTFRMSLDEAVNKWNKRAS